MTDWVPSVSQVGALMPQRFGADGPDENTIPSADQIKSVVEMKTDEVRTRCGRISETEDAEILSFAATVVAYGAASHIEASWWPEQPGEAAVYYRRRFEEHVEALRRQVLYHWKAHR